MPFWKTLLDDMEQRLKWCIFKVVILLLKNMDHVRRVNDVKLHNKGIKQLYTTGSSVFTDWYSNVQNGHTALP